jgi:hypothetical protein
MTEARAATSLASSCTGNSLPESTTESGRLQTVLARLLLTSDNCNHPESTGIGPALQLLVFFIAAALVVSHRPDALFNPQFFAEDGTIWYPEAYMSGWFAALFHSRNGYFQTLPRLASAIALIVPLRFAPMILNVIGITIQVLPVNLLVSTRCRNWAPLFARALMAILYLGLPNTRELDAAPEEGQWHLALLACIIVLGCPPLKTRWRVFDIAVILLSGFSGPFSVVLLPITLIFWWRRREPWRLIVAGTVAVPAIVQLSALLASAEATRSHATLGATPQLAVQLLAGQVYLGAMLGQSSVQVDRSLPVLALIAVLGTAVVLYCFIKARLEWKLLIAFCMLVFAASLKNPMVSMTVPQWQVLRDSSGIRYWFFPMIAFVWALAWCATLSNNGLFRLAGVGGLIMTCAGMAADWKHPAYSDHHFAESAAKFAAAAPGMMVNIPILPNGWTMRLVKKSPGCHGLLVGSVDQPKPGGKLAGSVPVIGWVLADQPISRVSIYLDRHLVQSITPNEQRPDVDSMYPQSPDKYKGWAAFIDTSQFAPGSHEVELRALERDGCERDFAIIPVERPQ